MDENNRASDTSCHRAGIASQLSPLTRSSLSECSSLTQGTSLRDELNAAFGDPERFRVLIDSNWPAIDAALEANERRAGGETEWVVCCGSAGVAPNLTFDNEADAVARYWQEKAVPSYFGPGHKRQVSVFKRTTIIEDVGLYPSTLTIGAEIGAGDEGCTYPKCDCSSGAMERCLSTGKGSRARVSDGRPSGRDAQRLDGEATTARPSESEGRP